MEFFHLLGFTCTSNLVDDGCPQDLLLLSPKTALSLMQVVVPHCPLELTRAFLELSHLGSISPRRPLALGLVLFDLPKGRVSLNANLQSELLLNSNFYKFRCMNILDLRISINIVGLLL